MNLQHLFLNLFVCSILTASQYPNSQIISSELIKVQILEYDPVLAIKTKPSNSVTVFRDELVRYLQQRITLSGKIANTLSDSEQKELLLNLKKELASLAVKSLPPTLSAPDEYTFKRLLGTNTIVDKDTASEALEDIEKWLLYIVDRFAFTWYVIPPSGETRETLERQIHLLVSEQQKCVIEHWSVWFSLEEAQSAVSRSSEIMIGKIADRTTYAYKVPAKEELFEQIITEQRQSIIAAKEDMERLPKEMPIEAVRIRLTSKLNISVIPMAEATTDPMWLQYEKERDSRLANVTK
jgi:hypothetical protein